MKRASEQGATGDATPTDDGGGGGARGGSLFSAFSGGEGGRNKERVDSSAIAQAALDKARNTMELKRFLEENKTDEQRYEEGGKKIDRQMSQLDDGE